MMQNYRCNGKAQNKKVRLSPNLFSFNYRFKQIYEKKSLSFVDMTAHKYSTPNQE